MPVVRSFGLVLLAAVVAPGFSASLQQVPPGLLGKHEGVVSSVAFSPDGKLVASSGHEDQTVRIWDRATGKEIVKFRQHTRPSMCVCFSPDGKSVASTGLEEAVRIWDPQSGKELQVLNIAPHPFGVAFAPDGKVVATAGHDRTVRLWEVATGKQLHALQGYNGRIWRVAFSPDGKLLASASEDGTTRLHDVGTGRELRQLVSADTHVTPAAFSPDGKLLASGGSQKIIRLWDVTTGRERGQLVGHQGEILDVAFSPDGRHLVSSGYKEAGVRLWEVATGKEVMQFAGNAPWPDRVAYAPDGLSVASAGRDAAVRVWDVNPHQGKPAPQEKDIAALVRDLNGLDARKTHAAFWALAAAPNLAVPGLREQIRQQKPDVAPAERIQRLIAQLDAEDFADREAASESLEKLAHQAEAALRREHAKPRSAEVGQRVTALLEKLEGSLIAPAAVPAIRTVALLGRLDTAAARDLLRTLASGPEGDWYAREAQAWLDRQQR